MLRMLFVALLELDGVNITRVAKQQSKLVIRQSVVFHIHSSYQVMSRRLRLI